MKRNEGRPHMKSKHKGLLLAVSFSILSLTILSINKYGNTYSLTANEKQTTFTLTIDSSNCPMCRSGSNASSSQVLTSLGNPIKLNRRITFNDGATPAEIDLTNTDNSLLLKGAKNKYNSSISIDTSTPFYKLLSIKDDFKIMSGKDDNTTTERLIFKAFSPDPSYSIELTNGTKFNVKGNCSYFDISYKISSGKAERQIYINSIAVEYSCLY